MFAERGEFGNVFCFDIRMDSNAHCYYNNYIFESRIIRILTRNLASSRGWIWASAFLNGEFRRLVQKLGNSELNYACYSDIWHRTQNIAAMRWLVSLYSMTNVRR